MNKPRIYFSRWQTKVWSIYFNKTKGIAICCGQYQLTIAWWD